MGLGVFCIKRETNNLFQKRDTLMGVPAGKSFRPKKAKGAMLVTSPWRLRPDWNEESVQ